MLELVVAFFSRRFAGLLHQLLRQRWVPRLTVRRLLKGARGRERTKEKRRDHGELPQSLALRLHRAPPAGCGLPEVPKTVRMISVASRPLSACKPSCAATLSCSMFTRAAST